MNLSLCSVGNYTQGINNVQFVTLNENTVSISWELDVPPIPNSNESFYLYYGIQDIDIYAGTTTNTHYTLTNLTTGVYYLLYVTMTHAFSNVTHNSEIYEFMISARVPEVIRLNIAGIAAIAIVVFFVLFAFGIFPILLLRYVLKRAGISINTLKGHLNVGKGQSDAYMINSSECESGHIIFNENSLQEEAHRNVDLVSVTDVTQQGMDVDSIYFANISQIDANSNDRELTPTGSQHNDIPTILSTQILDEGIDIPSPTTSRHTYIISPAKESDLNATYAIRPIINTQDTTEEQQASTDIEKSKILSEFEQLNAVHEENEFDVNFITLESPHFEDYPVNASFLYNYNFIATVHPTRRKNLLQLVYQNHCSLIVMLTSKTEQQKILTKASEYVRYWPIDENAPEQQSPLIVQEISLQHSMDNNTLSFKHVIFSGWNDDDDIGDIQQVIDLLRIIQTHKDQNPHTPVLIHCSDGVTKTGILMACYTALRGLEANNSYSIFEIVQDLRRQRTIMLPTLVSNILIYHRKFPINIGQFRAIYTG